MREGSKRVSGRNYLANVGLGVDTPSTGGRGRVLQDFWRKNGGTSQTSRTLSTSLCRDLNRPRVLGTPFLEFGPGVNSKFVNVFQL